MHGIADLALLGILLRHQFVLDITPEVAIVLENGTGDGGTQRRIHLAHEYRRLTERFCHPFGKGRLLACILVVHPKVPRPGYGVIAASEERTVGLCSKGGLYFFLGGGEMVVIGFVFVVLVIRIDNLRQTREQLVVLGYTLRHRTRSEKRCGQQI